jgi:elongation factor G
LYVPAVRGVHPKTGKETSREPTTSEHFSALAFKIASDRHGDLVFARIYSGTLSTGTRVLNATRGKRENVTRIWRLHANDREKLEKAVAGDIVGLVGMRNTGTGDTLCETNHPIVLEKMQFPETVISMAVEPKSTADKDKLTQALEKLAREDPTFRWSVDSETGQLVMSGMGELHLEVLKHRMLSDYSVAANVGAPRVSYRETITGTATAEGVFQRQSAGGKGQFGHVVLKVEPFKGEEAVAFENAADPEVVPRQFIPAVEDAAHGCAAGGVETGYPLINIKATLVGGSFDESDSTEVAFSAAASIALRDAVSKAGVALLEPIMRFSITTPPDYVGDVISDLNSRRAEISKMEMRGQSRLVEGTVPLREVFGYVTKLRSLSQGMATVSLEPCEYRLVPDDVFRELMSY